MPQLDCATFFIIIISIVSLYIIGFGVINLSSFFYYCNGLKVTVKRNILIYFVTIYRVLLKRKLGFSSWIFL